MMGVFYYRLNSLEKEDIFVMNTDAINLWFILHFRAGINDSKSLRLCNVSLGYESDLYRSNITDIIWISAGYQGHLRMS